MNSPPLGHGVIDEATGTPPPSLPMNNPPVPHQVICMPTEPIPAAVVDRFFKRTIKKSDAFTIGLFFASFGLLISFLNNKHSSDHFAIALGLRLFVLNVTVLLYSYSCFSDPGPQFPKVQVTVLVFCVGLLVLAIFLTHNT